MLKVYSVIVSYYPIVSNLIHLSKILLDSGASVIIVDNSKNNELNECKELENCNIIFLGKNTGIAHAQNIGIREAIKGGAEVIVFFDHDSKIGYNFLPLLLVDVKKEVPGIVAPVYFDEIKGYEFPSMRLNRFGMLVKVYKENKTVPYNVDVVISSGIAATVSTFNIAGLMDEDLFIDFVDTEWCLRCRKKGIPIQIIPSVIMEHTIGGRSKKIGNLTIFVHSPIRCYYQIRNCFLLFKKKHIPFLLALKEFLSVGINRLILLFVVKNKLQYLKYYCLAISHGFKGFTGKKS